jgi:hypothetical protein
MSLASTATEPVPIADPYSFAASGHTVDVNKPGAPFHYLDHAGATLYSDRQLDSAMQQLSSGIWVNPHKYVSQMSAILFFCQIFLLKLRDIFVNISL